MPNHPSTSPSDDANDPVLAGIPDDLLHIDGVAPIDLPERAMSVDFGADYQSLLVQHNKRERERDDALRNAAEHERRLLLAMLDVADALDRLIASAAQTSDPATKSGKALIDGLESSRRILLRNLGKFEVKRLSTLGAIPDTEFCAIDSEREDESAEPGAVVEELIIGYTHKGKSLRTAVVVVAA